MAGTAAVMVSIASAASIGKTGYDIYQANKAADRANEQMEEQRMQAAKAQKEADDRLALENKQASDLAAQQRRKKSTAAMGARSPGARSMGKAGTIMTSPIGAAGENPTYSQSGKTLLGA